MKIERAASSTDQAMQALASAYPDHSSTAAPPSSRVALQVTIMTACVLDYPEKQYYRENVTHLPRSLIAVQMS